MPIFSERRGTNLLSIEECARCFGKSQGTINNRISQLKPYIEYHQVEPGKKPISFVDPFGLGYELPPQVLHEFGATSQGKSSEVVEANFTAQLHIQIETSRRKETASQPAKVVKPGQVDHKEVSRALAHEVDLQEAASRFELLRPLLLLPEGKRSQSAALLSKELGVSKRTVYRWLTRFNKSGIKALSRSQRKDRGCPRIPKDSYHLIVQALISNTASTSTKMVYRTLLRAVPEVMQYERGSKTLYCPNFSFRGLSESIADQPSSDQLSQKSNERL